jgi:hypothetical protein
VKRYTEQVVLTCKECGEQLVLLGSVEDWRSRHAVFLCDSTHKLTLDDYTEEEVLPTAS